MAVLEAEAAVDEATAGILRVADAVAADEAARRAAAEGEEEHATGCGHETPERGRRCFFPAVDHAEFKWSKALLSLAIVAAGLLVGWFVCAALYTQRSRRLVGLTERSPAGARRLLLPGQQVLPGLALRERHRPGHRPPDRPGGQLGQPERHRRRRQRRRRGPAHGSAVLVYRNIDQRVVDGAVNGSGAVANGAGSALRPVQSGKVSQYGALLFGAAAVGALVLVIVNV